MSALDDSERRALREAVRDALEPPHGRPLVAPQEQRRADWTRLAEQLGLAGVSIDEALGGSGLGLAEELLVHEELGRVLSGLPSFGTVGLAAAALRALDSDHARELLTGIASGATTVAAVLSADGAVTGLQITGAAQVSGTVDCVVGGVDADLLLVLAVEGDERVLAWLSASDPRIVREPMTAVDLTRGYARIVFDAAPATVLARGPQAVQATEVALRNGYLALAAESVGLGGRALEMTVEYVKVRHQFGRPIGSFQAVKHRCADMLVQLETARSALAFAQHAAESGDPADSSAAVAVARMYCGRIPFWIANETIHLHGGIGFTWEHPAHLYYRRAKTNQVLLDTHEHQRRALAALVADRYDREEATQ